MGVKTKLIDWIKNLFSHNENRYIREQGNFALGNGLNSQLNKYKTTPELLVDGDFIRCVQILANDIAKIHFEIQELQKFDENEFYIREKKQSNWNYLWNINPSNDLSPQELKKTIVWNLILYGAAAIYIVRDKSNKACELIPIFRNFITRKTEFGIPYYIINFSGSTESKNSNEDLPKENDIRVENDDIIWIPYEILDNFSNVEFRTLYSIALNKIQQNQISQMNALTNDIGVSLFVKMKNASNAEQRLAVQQALRDSAKMMKETGMLAFVFDEKMDVSGNDKFVQSPVSLELRKYVAAELGAKFGIPPAFLGIETPNQSLSQLNRFYLDRGLEPLANLIVTKISYSIFGDGKRRVSYNTLNLAGLDLNEKVATISQAINNGIMTPNEGRAWLGLEPHPNGNELLANGAIQSMNSMKEKTEAEINKLDSEANKNNQENSLKNS